MFLLDYSDKNQHCNFVITGVMVELICFCQSNKYYILLQKNDGSLESVQNITTTSGICSESVNFIVEHNSTYCVTVFYGVNSEGILNTTVYFTKEFVVMEYDDKRLMNSSDTQEEITEITTREFFGKFICFMNVQVQCI